MATDPCEDVAQIGVRIDTMALGGSDEGAKDRGSLAATFIAREEPILPADHHATERVLGGVVVDVQIGIFDVACQRRPFDRQ